MVNIRKIKFELIRKSHLFWYSIIIKRLEAEKKPVPFICNICGSNVKATMVDICSRETPSCSNCGSNLRMRSIIHLLSLEFFGESLPLPDFPVRKDIFGIGMSDSDVYAKILAEKFSYTNTFYHTAPLFDITDVQTDLHNKFDFIISCDVLEHVMLPLETAFTNLQLILKRDGTCIITVPFMLFEKTLEHFPTLHKYEIIEQNEKKLLKNISKNGKRETFTDLTFHGGPGATLELRVFTKSSLIKDLKKANFREIKFHRMNFPKYGIIWPVGWSLPITARR